MSRPPRRFGWIESNGDGETINFGIMEAEIAEETWNEFNEILNVVEDIRPFIIDFIALEFEYERLNKNIHEINKSYMEITKKFGILGVSNISDLARVQSAITAYLGAARSGIEALKTLLIYKQKMAR